MINYRAGDRLERPDGAIYNRISRELIERQPSETNSATANGRCISGAVLIALSFDDSL